MSKDGVELYPFHNANIHERRFAARFCRAAPLLALLSFVSIIIYSVLKDELLLLALCAVMNVAFWLWITTTSLLGIAGSFLVANELKKRDESNNPNVSPYSVPQDDANNESLVHLIVFPNYKEDESILADTLKSLSEAENSHNFHVVLAMEAREGLAAETKAGNLQEQFADKFADLTHTLHPTDLNQEHMDDSRDLEVPGKSSNLKWAVNRSRVLLQKQESHSLDNVILTIADADCMFHPGYFSAVTKDFNELREKPGSEQSWCMWQAPQLSYRDHWQAPVCSRVWTYISSMYEFGGVSGLHWGGHHMVFSGYSMPLQLATYAQSWDGDVIAEDHHAYIKNFFYSAYVSATQSLSQVGMDVWNDGCQPQLQVRPIFLPVKSSPVVSDQGYWHTYVERWHQAKRHAQGLAELPFLLLVMWDMICTLPLSAYSFSLFYKMSRILMRLLCMHLLPICQGISLAAMTLYWFYFERRLQTCPNHMTIWNALESEYPLCALGGAWPLVWPMAIPIVCVIVANYTMVSVSFLMPGRMAPTKSTWHQEDGGIEARCGSKSFTVFVLIATDCVFFLSVMMVPYGLVACLLAMWNVCFSGNRFDYVTAAKAAKEKDKSNYGALAETKSLQP